MHVLRRSAAAALGLAVAVVLAGCTTTAESEPDDSVDSAASAAVVPTGTAPIVFAFVCGTDGSGRTETFTTYSAVWDDDRTVDCRARRITGTEMSDQQRDAVAATRGSATLEELATVCARTSGGPWTTAVTSEAEARVADGLVRYCPGHPAMAHLRDAIAAYRG
ncbi:hypothetical protein ACLBWP_03215 [Microbacterium sp. M1A1_1b]|uniref:hypothetical protein n=1 Tax=Curtobacterium sp. VKM Ac-2922 TaxID=2929475 RepID=UPI001FB54A3B|nr:hypothetical protein [Curtobacterium sp. VKM Ac-2922]MCJ1712584.1 hypothetical protein [Curtobacterium sp. VKM Ac-2922]